MTQWRPHGLYGPWNSPGQNTGVGSRSLLQVTQPRDRTQVSRIAGGFFFYQLNHKGSPRILEWVAYPFSRGSSWPRNWTRVSCIAGGFFTNWAIREAHSGLGTIEKYSKNMSKQFTEKKMQIVTKPMITCQLCQQGKVQITNDEKVFFFFFFTQELTQLLKISTGEKAGKWVLPDGTLLWECDLLPLFIEGSRCSCWHLRSAHLLICLPLRDSVPQKRKHLRLKVRLQGCGQSTVCREQNPEAKQVPTCVGKFAKLWQLPLSHRISSIYYNKWLYFFGHTARLAGS